MSRLINKTELARTHGVSLKCVDGWILGGLPYVRRGSLSEPWVIDADAAAEWLGRRRSGKFTQPASPEQRETLAQIAIPWDYLLPWQHDQVMSLREYEQSIGLDHDSGEILEWIAYGFPILPPGKGEKLARVSRPHAELWRLLFAGLIETLGGNGLALHLGREMRKLRGLPLS